MIACHSKHDRGGVEVGGAAISPLAVLRLPFEAMFKLSPTRFVGTLCMIFVMESS